MIQLSRRKLVQASAGLLAAPAIIRPSSAWFPRGAASSGSCPSPGAVQCSVTSGDALLNNALFVPFVKFFGTADNGSAFSTRAMATGVTLTPPWFAIGFETCLDFFNFGCLFCYGNHSNGAEGNLVYAFHGSAIACFNHSFNPESTTANTPFIYCGNAQAININQWCCLCWVVPDTIGLSTYAIIDGVTGPTAPNQAYGHYPDTVGGGTTDLQFGSYGPLTVGAGDQDNLQGGLRNWSIINGAGPTLTEYRAYRAGASPQSIWGSGNVIAQYAFTSDPRMGVLPNAAVGATEPDLSGNGHTLTYYNSGADPSAVLPQLMTCQT